MFSLTLAWLQCLFGPILGTVVQFDLSLATLFQCGPILGAVPQFGAILGVFSPI